MNQIKREQVEKFVVNPQTDKCLICGTPIKDGIFSWRIFHGEAGLSCCGADYQIKSYYVDEKEDPIGHEFAESLDDPTRIWFKIEEKWIEPLKRALKETGETNVRKDVVIAKAEEFLKKETQ